MSCETPKRRCQTRSWTRPAACTTFESRAGSDHSKGNELLFPITSILVTGVGQLCAYAMYAMMGIGLLKRGMVASVSCALRPFMAMACWMLFIVQPIGVELN